jgi:hypothetical protein
LSVVHIWFTHVMRFTLLFSARCAASAPV